MRLYYTTTGLRTKLTLFSLIILLVAGCQHLPYYQEQERRAALLAKYKQIDAQVARGEIDFWEGEARQIPIVSELKGYPDRMTITLVSLAEMLGEKVQNGRLTQKEAAFRFAEKANQLVAQHEEMISRQSVNARQTAAMERLVEQNEKAQKKKRSSLGTLDRSINCTTTDFGITSHTTCY